MAEMKVTKTTLNLATGKITTHELKGKELKEWKESHGFIKKSEIIREESIKSEVKA